MGWIANILFVYGIYVLGRHSRSGFVANCVANGLYVVIGLRAGLWDLVAISVVMSLLNVRNWILWGKKPCIG